MLTPRLDVPGMNCAGIILCGGKSSRMGRPKAWLPFDGEVMLARVHRLLSEAVDSVVVVAAEGQSLPPLPDAVPIIRDEVAGRGPLQGLAAGLQFLHGKADAAFVSSCDVPFLNPEFVRRMINLLGESWIAVPQANGFHHPLAAVYRMAVLPAVQQLLAANRLRTYDLFAAVPTRIVLPEEWHDIDPESRSLKNVNTPQDLVLSTE